MSASGNFARSTRQPGESKNISRCRWVQGFRGLGFPSFNCILGILGFRALGFRGLGV